MQIMFSVGAQKKHDTNVGGTIQIAGEALYFSLWASIRTAQSPP